MENQCPDRVDQEKDDSERVRYTMALCKRISESTWCPDVLLQQVATDEKTDQDANPAVLQRVRKQVWSHNQKKDQRSRHL